MTYIDKDDAQWRANATYHLENTLNVTDGDTHNYNINTDDLNNVSVGKIIVTMLSDSDEDNTEYNKPISIKLNINFEDGSSQEVNYLPCFANENIISRNFTDFELNNNKITSASLDITCEGAIGTISISQLDIYFDMINEDLFDHNINNYFDNFVPDPGIDYPWEDPSPTPTPTPGECIIPLLSLDAYQQYENGEIDLTDGSVWRAEWHEIATGVMVEPLTQLRAVNSDTLSTITLNIDRYMQNNIEGGTDPSRDPRIENQFNLLDDYSSKGLNKNDRNIIQSYIDLRQDDPAYADIIEDLESYLQTDEGGETNE